VASLREQLAGRKRAAEQELSELEAIERRLDTDKDDPPGGSPIGLAAAVGSV
jgi:hypothetical protein